MAPKQQRSPAPDDLAEAVTAANSALAERARLEALRPALAADLKAAVVHRDVVGQEAKAAELDVVLSGDPPAPKLVTIAAEARRAHDLAANAVIRLEHAMQALPARLAQSDEGLTAARLRLDPLLQEARQAGIAEFEREVIAATAPLVALAARWRARTAGLGIGSQFLTELRVPALTTAVPILSGRATLALDGTTVTLDDVWQSDSDAVAMFREGQSSAALQRRWTVIRTVSAPSAKLPRSKPGTTVLPSGRSGATILRPIRCRLAHGSFRIVGAPP